MLNLYIAYGANLCRRSMRQRCPDARPLGRILLKNHQLVFRGVADVIPCEGSEVPCGVWTISKSDEAALDRFEGVNGDRGMYIKDRSLKLRFQGEKHRALIYLMNSNGIHPPSQFYVDTIRRGYGDFNLDEKYLDDAIERSFTEKRHDSQTRNRRDRQLSDPLNYQLVSRRKVFEPEVKK